MAGTNIGFLMEYVMTTEKIFVNLRVNQYYVELQD